jgi:hypothetical protein
VQAPPVLSFVPDTIVRHETSTNVRVLASVRDDFYNVVDLWQRGGYHNQGTLGISNRFRDCYPGLLESTSGVIITAYIYNTDRLLGADGEDFTDRRTHVSATHKATDRSD